MKSLYRILAMLCVFPGSCVAQQAVRLSLSQAIAMATSPNGNASVQLANAAAQVAGAHLAYAHSLLLPLIEASVGESNLTRNLAAEGFNFPTGVPNFTIPAQVGPFNNFDARVTMTQNVFDLSALHRARGLRANLDAAKANVNLHRELSAAQVAHDYLVALRADSSMEAAQAAINESEALLKTAQDRADTGKAPELEVTRAKLTLLADQRKLSAAQNDSVQAKLHLLEDLGLSYATELQLADHLTFATDDVPDVEAAVATAFQSRPELQENRERKVEAHANDIANRDGWLPVVTGYGDVGPLDGVVTHTVGVSARITVFDGGRRGAERAETTAMVRESEIRERDLRRKIELEVRSAHAALKAAAAQAVESQMALKLSGDELAEAQRRFEAGVIGNSEVVEAQTRSAQAQDDLIGVLFNWNQARVDLAEATGTASTLSMR